MIKQLANKYKMMSEDVKCSIYYIVCNLFQKGIAFITVPIFTRMMSTDQYGQFSVFQSWMQIFIIFTSFNIAYGILNKALTKYEQHDEYISSIQLFYTIITIVFILLYYIVKYNIGNFFNVPFWIEILMFIELIVTPAMSIFTVKNRFFLKYKTAVFVTMILTVLNPILGIIFVSNSSDKGVARIASYLIAQIIICTPIYIYNFYKGKKIINKEYWKYTFTFSLPLLPYFLSTIILNQSDKIMISKMCGDSYAGIYSISFSIAMLVKIFNESINASFVPWLYKKIKSKNLSGIRSVTNKSILGIGILNILLILLTPEIIYIVASEKYLDAMYIMPLLTFSVSLIFEISLFNNIEIYFEKNKIIMISSVIISLLNIILNYFFIKLFGYFAASFTTVFCYIVLLLWNMIYCKKTVKDITKIIEYKKIILINSIIAFFCIFSTITYKYTILRIMLFILLLTYFIFVIKKVIGGTKDENKN